MPLGRRLYLKCSPLRRREHPAQQRKSLVSNLFEFSVKQAQPLTAGERYEEA
jgi:hypothetical protein